tara:strand:+ start:575 stop:1324 length:750 start_codon:yes stop_codon:yes gene_type:complete
MGINDHTTNELTSYYNSYLLKEQENHKEKYKEFEGWFSASTAGSCYRKQYFNVNNYEGTQPDDKSLRLMRLGTLVHKDIADMYENYREDIESKKGVKLFVERQVRLEEYNIVGHLDLAIYDKESNSLEVTDIKTAHSYKWKMLFGRNPDKNPSVNYYLQVGTYAYALAKELELDLDNVRLSLTWYKKDDSSIRAQKIDNNWMTEALNYWTDLNIALADNKEPTVGDNNTPVYDWECKYCPYHNIHCEGI